MKTPALVVLLLSAASLAQAQAAMGGMSGQVDNAQTTPRSGSGFSFGELALEGGNGAVRLRLRDARLADAVADQVVFVTADPAPDISAIAAAAGIQVIEAVRLTSISQVMVVAKLTSRDTPEAAATRLAGLAGVAWAQPNHLYQALGVSRPLPRRFELEGLTTDPASRVGGLIAMIDTPVAAGHETFKAADFGEQVFGASAKPGAHGTAVASILVGGADTPGSARGARLISLAAFSTGPNNLAVSQTRYLAKAFEAAVRLKPDVLNLSFGGSDDRLLTALLDTLEAKGVCVVAAAGNGGAKAAVPFPATHHASLAVTAVDEALRPYAYATQGARIDVAAVGVDIIAAVPGGYRRVSGTSFSSAFVAGALLGMPQCRVSHQPAAMRSAARVGAQDLGAPGPDPVFGAGLFRVAN